MKVYRLPATFIRDRTERDLPCGDGRYVGTQWVAKIDAETLADIISDAHHYAGDGLDAAPRNVVESARRTIAAIRNP